MRKNFAILVCKCLIAGAVLNVLVTITIIMYNRYSGSSGDASIPGVPYHMVTTASSTVIHYDIVSWNQALLNTRSSRPIAESPCPYWSTVHQFQGELGRGGHVLLECSVGWPFRTTSGRMLQSPAPGRSTLLFRMKDAELSRVGTVREGYLHHASPEGLQVQFLQDGVRLIPMVLIVPGLLINSMIYGTVILSCWMCLCSVSRRWRAMRGLCIKCGYYVRGHTCSRCPECGAALPPESTSAVHDGATR